MIAPLYQYYFLFLSDCRFQSIRITVSKGGPLSILPDALFQSIRITARKRVCKSKLLDALLQEELNGIWLSRQTILKIGDCIYYCLAVDDA
jgi:transposase